MNFIDRLFRILISGNRRVAFIIAIVSLALGIVIRSALGPAFRGFPFITFWPAVMLTGLVGGWQIASITAAIVLLYGWYALVLPLHQFTLVRNDLIGLSIGALVGAAIIAVTEAVRIAARRLHAEQVRTANLLAERDLMFRELQHRVANNMQFVASLLILQGRRLTPGSVERLVFKESADRLVMFASVHRKLHDAQSTESRFEELAEEILHDLLKATGCAMVTLTVRSEPIKLPLDTISTLVLIATEAATNSVKHAFAPRLGTTLTVTLARIAGNYLELSIQDDGPGFPAIGANPDSTSLGLKILQALAGRLNGTLHLESRSGALVRVTFPRPPT
jgi:two-component sensor histidine kinase